MTARKARPEQAWLPWDLNGERERAAAAYREAFRAAYPGGAAAWLSRPDAPGPESEAVKAWRSSASGRCPGARPWRTAFGGRSGTAGRTRRKRHHDGPARAVPG